jgi:hypothetical protein
VSATVYATWVRDPIAPSGSASPLHPLPQFVNRTGIDARGLDLEASRTFPGNRSLRLVWSIQHAEDALTGVRIAGVPAHLARLSANLPAGRYLIVSPALTLRSARPRAAGDARGDLGGYGLFDVVLRGRNFHPALEVSAVVRDLFDAGRFDPSPLGGLPGDYPRLGRTAFVKVKYRF